jgi:ParB family chromosome partitioning protein
VSAAGAGGAAARAADLGALRLPVAAIVPDPALVRATCSAERLAALAASIRAAGVLQPLLVRPHPDAAARAVTPYMLLTGERRWRAAQWAGLAAVPAIVVGEPLGEGDRLMLRIDDNDPALREALPVFAVAQAVACAFALARCSREAFAERHHRPAGWLAELLGLANAQGTVRTALAENRFQSVLAARTFMRLAPAQQVALLAEARRDGISISLRRAEQAASYTTRSAARGTAQARGGPPCL